jgi:hypothetical protein
MLNISYGTDRIENTASDSSSVIRCVFVGHGTFLYSRCLAKRRRKRKIRQRGEISNYLFFKKDKESRSKMARDSPCKWNHKEQRHFVELEWVFFWAGALVSSKYHPVTSHACPMTEQAWTAGIIDWDTLCQCVNVFTWGLHTNPEGRAEWKRGVTLHRAQLPLQKQ